MINIVAPWARELKGPTSYLPRYYNVENPKPGEKFHIDPKLLTLRLAGTGLRKVRAALAHRKKVRAAIVIRGVDAAGNVRTKRYRATLRR